MGASKNEFRASTFWLQLALPGKFNFFAPVPASVQIDAHLAKSLLCFLILLNFALWSFIKSKAGQAKTDSKAVSMKSFFGKTTTGN